MVIGWSVVALYAGLLAWTSLRALERPHTSRQVTSDAAAPERFSTAWERSRRSTFVAIGTYERRSGVTGAVLSSEDVVVQRPPQRLHRQMGGVEGRVDDRLIVCPAPPTGHEDQAQPCRLGPPSGPSYAASVAREVAGVRSLTGGPRPLYRVSERRPGCFDLVLLRIEPRAPFGVRASFCFDATTGAVSSSTVRHEGGITEAVVVSSIRTAVTAADLQP